MVRVKFKAAMSLSIMSALVVLSGSVAWASPDTDELELQLESVLKVFNCTTDTLELPMNPDEFEFLTGFEMGGMDYTLDLFPHSVRSPESFQVLVPRADDTYEQVTTPLPHTLRGVVLGVPGSSVSASLIDGQLKGTIIMNDLTWYIQPVSDVIDGYARDVHVLYNANDYYGGDWKCGTDTSGVDDMDHFLVTPRLAGYEDIAVDPDKVCEIAFDADYEFYVKNGSSVNNTIADIEAIVNDMEFIYQRDTGIVYDITTIIVRDSEPDPYTTTSPDGLLSQFQNHWNSKQGSVQRDIAHLMTGKSLDGSVIGIAYLSVICNKASGYGLAESRFRGGGWNSRVGLSAHEIGHNWSAGHCSGSGCYIMCATLGSCGGDVTKFGTYAKGKITSYRDTRSCLDDATDFKLAVSMLYAGQNADFDITQGDPNASVAVYYSVRGEGSCYVSGYNITLNLQSCKKGLEGTTDSNGNKHWTTKIPKVKTPRLIWIQAAMQGQSSNLVVGQIN